MEPLDNTAPRLAEGTAPGTERSPLASEEATPRETELGAKTHDPPCVRRTWCVLSRDHLGACVEVPRAPYRRPAWDLRTPDPRGWRRRR